MKKEVSLYTEADLEVAEQAISKMPLEDVEAPVVTAGGSNPIELTAEIVIAVVADLTAGMDLRAARAAAKGRHPQNKALTNSQMGMIDHQRLARVAELTMEPEPEV